MFRWLHAVKGTMQVLRLTTSRSRGLDAIAIHSTMHLQRLGQVDEKRAKWAIWCCQYAIAFQRTSILAALCYIEYENYGPLVPFPTPFGILMASIQNPRDRKTIPGLRSLGKLMNSIGQIATNPNHLQQMQSIWKKVDKKEDNLINIFQSFKLFSRLRITQKLDEMC